jgi:S1-C subfamily serine protease
LKVGDIVRKVNGQEIKDWRSFLQQLARTRPGEEVSLEIKRDNKEMSLKVTTETRRGRRSPRP